MNRRRNIRDHIWLALAVLSLVLMVFAVATPRAVGDTDSAARKVERRLSRRMARLDWYVQHPQQKLPEDMVIYVYEGDSLLSWRNKFPLYNDDISSRVVVQRIANPKVNLRSPLSYVTEEPGFLNIGPNWYIVKMQETDGRKVISGLLVSSTLDNASFRGVNPQLHLGRRFSVRPLTFSGGSPVSLGGKPVFKVLYDSLTGVVVANAVLLWISLALFLSAAVAFVFMRRTLRRALISVAGILLATAAMYFWGRSAQSEYAIFSPMVYAGGSLLFSLGAVLLLNLAVLLCVTVVYLVRRSLWQAVSTKRAAVLLSALDVLLLLTLLAYVHLTLSSIISNSNISLELYKLGSLSVYSFVVYSSFLSVLAVVPMMLQMLQPAFSRVLGRRIDFFSGPARVAYSLVTGIYLVVAFAVLGFQKEEGRVEVWAGKLAVDRDITLELQLLKVERPIAEDAVVSALAFIDGAEVIIRNRIIDHYLLAESADYSISVHMVRPGVSSPQSISAFEHLTSEGVPISDGSFFLCSGTQEGPARYDGIFTYFHPSGMVAHLVLDVEQKNLPDGKGYSRLLSQVSTNRLNVPSAYSYSRYQGRDLRLFKGEYPYSTRMDDWMYDSVYKDRVCHYVRDGFVHFVNVITDDEAVIISRREIGFFSYVVAAVFAALVMYLLLLGLKPKRRGPSSRERNYFRSWMSWTLMLSLITAMVVMASVSVFFVYRRNEANQVAIMSDRINAMQLLAQNGLRGMDIRDVQHSSELVALIQSVSDNTGSDISVYSTDGRIIVSTNPEALDYMLLGYRIDEEALDQIMRLNKRYCIRKETLGWRHYHTMYMPLIGPDGSIVAILSAPYVEESYDFERDAVTHSMTIITVFILLFLLARLMESAALDRVFRPLSLMGRTMSRAGQGALEHISYGRTDEISALVDAYNRMVDELGESTRKLAQAERDKAWNSMARQVAHEIKNPLTPMKLQIQRLIRLKQKGDPSWEEKFEAASKVLLDHIDVLTETSNEFSTLARLYTEPHTRLDLDSMLKDEISMFDNRDDVRFTYIGMEGASVLGPKPQLSRVFVNLLGNAVQAVEGREGAEILVSLRKSIHDGYYDIVVEDNGPGVSEENIPKLFTPNFTTKSGGSGLGLAISRSVLDNCGATIDYSRSFALGGACFTIHYPAIKA
jgi:signal transduction histidine kinase